MTVKEIEAAISWLWDKQIEHDLESGCLDALLAEVDKEYEAGRAQPLYRPCHEWHG